MSTKYTGGFITKNPVAPTTSAASGIWTLDQQQQAQKAGTWPSPPIFIEDLFSTYLYVGNGATQTITNGINLSGQGGLVWTKARSSVSGAPTYYTHELTDTVRGANNGLTTSTTAAQSGSDLNGFTSTGFNLTVSTGRGNAYEINYVSWTFRKQPKFFDIVTFTADLSNANQRISHNLGSVPGTIIIKCTNIGGSFSDWWTYHRSLGRSAYLKLNATTASTSSTNFWGTSDPTSTDFGFNAFDWGLSGGTYVAYLFAHDAGGFPVSGSGSTNGISCGTFTPSAGGSATVTLGYEPQWILVKATGTTGNWTLIDTMRNYSLGGNSSGTNDYLRANTSDEEFEAGTGNPTATGFFIDGVVAASQPHIYIAIRRGPMKTPTVGTSVYNGIARTGNGTATTVSNSGFTPDMVMSAPRVDGPSYGLAFPFDRLRGALKLLETRSTGAEQTGTGTLTGFDTMNGYIVGTDAASYGAINTNTVTYINWNFKRAPGFFDVVCVTDIDYQVTATHNLGVVPELIISKDRNGSSDWYVWASLLSTTQTRLKLNSTNASANTGFPINSVTASSFYAATGNTSTATQVFYLFATVAGVSKVGSYTGTGALLTVNCGFTSGARFVLIKRTDSTGDWFTYDSARGITAGNDPYLLLNNLAAEVTGTNYVDTDTTGFQVTAAAPAGLNASGGTYIFLAIA